MAERPTMRRSRLLIALVCYLLALPLQMTDFATMGGLAPFWNLVAFALLLIGAVIFWLEYRRMKRGAGPPK